MAVIPSQTNPDGAGKDLLPMSWLIERGCSVLCDDAWVFTTPKQTRITMARYETMPYLTAEQIQFILDDLPEATENGRSGKPACTSVISMQTTYATTTVCRVRWWDQCENCNGVPDTGASELEEHEDHNGSAGNTLPQPVLTGSHECRSSIRSRLPHLSDIQKRDLGKW